MMYTYIGPKEFLNLVDKKLIGRKVKSKYDILDWIISTEQELNINNEVIATFIIDLEQNLRINDRRSEHVVCAGGLPVLSAGEITFKKDTNNLIVSEISNQSTGYCPDAAKSWSHINKALCNLGIDYPVYFTTIMIFRICKNCKSINLVKDEYFFCAICDSKLDMNIV